jgi:adenosylcobinamide-GDP ribazoletransferase
MTFPAWVRGLRACFFFLTRIPVGGFPFSDDDWRWSTAWFPLVGATLGLVLGGVMAALLGAGSLVAAVLAVGTGLLMTGYFHEDGLADTADALGGGSSPARVLEILKDSRIGAFGAAALTTVLMLRVALLAGLDLLAPITLVWSQSASRFFPLLLMVTMPYAQADAVSKSKQVTRASWPQLLVAGLLTVAVGTFAVKGLGLNRTGVAAGVLVAGGLTALLGLKFKARAGGITGDFLGATQQLCECALLLGVCLWRG